MAQSVLESYIQIVRNGGSLIIDPAGLPADSLVQLASNTHKGTVTIKGAGRYLAQDLVRISACAPGHIIFDFTA